MDVHWHCLLGRNISRTTVGSVCIVCICPDNMRMTCTYVDNGSKYEMYITYASVNNIQITLTMCMCGDNVQKLNCR